VGETRIGTSGWLYPRWRKTFYPEGLPHARELAYIASRMNSVELNGSFYSLQRAECYLQWREATPEGFVFAVKGSRFISHMKKLREPEGALANFFASGLLALGDKLGPILWQLPPNLGFDEQRMRAFFEALPRDTAAAVRLAKKHDHRVKSPYTRTDARRPIRYALEVRHDSFATPAFVDLLREHDVALCIADTAGKFPYLEDVTADFVYVRLHGDVQLYTSGYSDAALDKWARKVKGWRRARRDVYVYFDNDAKVHAPFDALSLAEKCGVRWNPARRAA
jgi:uncharacterized protein YecE (DUF72 family)